MAEKALSFAFWLNLVFAIIEIFGGIYTNSAAIIADAFHDLGDALAIGLAVALERISAKKRTPGFSYGYRRFSLLSALLLSGILLVGAVVMSIGAVSVLLRPEPVNSAGMLWLAVIGVLINGAAFLRLWEGTDHNHHGHRHSAANHNSRAVMLHLLEDILGWVAVLIGAAVMYLTEWYMIDGILALLIAVFIAFNAVKNLFSTMNVLLQATPEGVDVNAITGELLELESVIGIHDLHVWSLDGNYNIGSLHVVVRREDGYRHEAICREVSSILVRNGINHPTVQVETDPKECGLEDC